MRSARSVRWFGGAVVVTVIGAATFYLLAPQSSVPRGAGYGGGYYHTSQGSEAYPYAWFKVLERHDSEVLFRENLERFGLIPDEKGPLNPLGLPIGLTVSKHDGAKTEMIGMSCAACHMGRIDFKGQSLLIDGGSGLFDSNAYFDELYLATMQTIRDRDKRFRFLRRYFEQESRLGKLFRVHEHRNAMDAAGKFEVSVLEAVEGLFEEETKDLDEFFDRSPHTGPLDVAWDQLEDIPDEYEIDDYDAKFKDHDVLDETPATGDFWGGADTKSKRHTLLSGIFRELAKDLRLTLASLQYLENFASGEFGPETPAGPGRVDAFGKVRNLLLPIAYGKEVIEPATAPVSIPSLWGMKDMMWLHWNGNTNSAMQRNILEALGSGAMVDLDRYDSTVDFENLHVLEQMVRGFQSPPWPAGLLGPLDPDRVDRGKAIYDGASTAYADYRKGNCAECHGQVDSMIGRLIVYPQYSFEVIGTDPNHARHFNRPVENVGAFPEVIEALTEKIMNRYYTVNQIPVSTQEAWEDHRKDIQWRSPIDAPLPARPLPGIWASAPFLHNGSVPTLYHLLLPAEERPKTFPLGHWEYDPKTVGYRLDVTGAPYTFDVNQVVVNGSGERFPELSNGNSNGGHEFGVDLTEEERLDLLEYLKSL